MLSKEQANQIKQQLLQHVENSLPEQDKESAKKHIESLDEAELEDFLKRNNLATKPSGGEKCIFCSIIFGDIPSSKISEDENAIATLEINPISKGHVLIIPKNHTEEISESVESFAKAISKNMESKLSPKKIITSESSLFNHKIINLIPVYNDENKNSERYSANKEELEEIQELLSSETIKDSQYSKEPSPTVKTKKPRKKRITNKNTWLPKRIP